MMKRDPAQPLVTTDDASHRHDSMRLAGYDYATPGAYFVTICTADRACILGSVVDGSVRLTAAGELVASTWVALPRHYAHVSLDQFVIMPNHVHGLLLLSGSGIPDPPGGAPKSRRATVSEVVRGFKTFSAKRINDLRGTRGTAVWQRNFHEHIVRDEPSLDRIRQYIVDNPEQWASDRENPWRQGPPLGRV